MTTEEFAKTLAAKNKPIPMKSIWEEINEPNTTEIPAEILDDISFMLGSIEESTEYLADILRDHGYSEKQFGFIGIDDDPALVMDIFHRFYNLDGNEGDLG